MTQSFLDDQQILLYEQKFKWQSIFDLMLLYHQMLQFYDRLKGIDKTLALSIDKVVSIFEQPDHQHKRISAFLASKNQAYFK
jgi:hypothetical protein